MTEMLPADLMGDPVPAPTPEAASVVEVLKLRPIRLVFAGDEGDQTQPKPSTGSGLRIVDFRDFLRETLPVRQFVLDPILPERGLAMVFGARGIGKTRVSCGIAAAAATGGHFLRWRAHRPRKVLYCDGEMPQEMLQERLKALISGMGIEPEPGYIKLLAADRQELGTTLNLADPYCQRQLEEHLEDVELLVVDNLSTLVAAGPENDAESWDAMQAWLLSLRRQSLTVLLVHHAGRNGHARGTSKREDVLDTVIELRRPDDYEPDQGARFEIHYSKARGIFGDNALPFQASLKVDNGRDHWDCQTLRDLVADDVAELTREGKTVRAIATELCISRSAVNRIQTRLRMDGTLP